MSPESLISRMFLISLLAAIAISLISYLINLPTFYNTLLSLAVFIGCHIVFYSWLILSAESKSKFVDSVLPDALRLVSSNLRSGLTIDAPLCNRHARNSVR